MNPRHNVFVARMQYAGVTPLLVAKAAIVFGVTLLLSFG